VRERQLAVEVGTVLRLGSGSDHRHGSGPWARLPLSDAGVTRAQRKLQMEIWKMGWYFRGISGHFVQLNPSEGRLIRPEREGPNAILEGGGRDEHRH